MLARSGVAPKAVGLRAAAPSQSTPLQLLTRLLTDIARTRGAGFGLIILAIAVVAATGSQWIAVYDPNAQDYTALRQAPSLAHLFGTDHVGRDVLSRVVYGARISLAAGFLSVCFAALVGVPLGLIAGYRRGPIDALIMRTCDALWAFPTLVLALAITAALGPNLVNILVAVSIVFTPLFARLARAETLALRERDFVVAAIGLGGGAARLLRVHILPNILPSILVQASLLAGSAMLIEASLGFLGVGVRPPTPSWGADLRDGARFMRQAWWMSVFPGLALFVTVLAINFVGDGLRRVLDPRLRGRL